VVAATEADDGAAMTMQLLKLISGGQPAGFNDFRYWDPRQGLYWFVNSGALAPFFARGSHISLAGSWSERQTPMYFGKGGGTCSVWPGARRGHLGRFSYSSHKWSCAPAAGHRRAHGRAMEGAVAELQPRMAALVPQALRTDRMENQFQPSITVVATTWPTSRPSPGSLAFPSNATIPAPRGDKGRRVALARNCMGR